LLLRQFEHFLTTLLACSIVRDLSLTLLRTF